MIFRGRTLTLEAALRDLGSRNARARLDAALSLGDVQSPDARERAVDALMRVTGDERADVRVAACSSLGELGDERAAESLVACIDDVQADVRQTAVIALGRLGAVDGFEALATALTDGPADVRFQSATSLVEIDAEAAAAPLLAALADEEDAEVLGAIALALGAVGQAAAIEPLVALLENPKRSTRFDAAYALAQLGDSRATVVLANYCHDEATSWDAVSALDMLRATDELAAAALDVKTTWRGRLLAAEKLLKHAQDHASASQARAVLCQGLAQRKLEIRGQAVDALAAVGDASCLGDLRQLRSRLSGRRLHAEIDSAVEAIEERSA